MSDIFISYSRRDSEQALALAGRLRLEGINVWIDRHEIVGAEQWATEIVDAIRECSTFLLLLSAESVQSDNVLKELSLAHETRRRILPVVLRPTELPSSFMYPLAGIQRVALSDYDAILRAHKHGVERVVLKDSRKSLMILPFEDLSSAQDNGWFADGIVSELLSVLGYVKALRLIDWNTSKEFKLRKVPTATLAKELDVRYFLEGQVRKIGPMIKVSVSLLDFETGDHLWQGSMKGTMDEVFRIQEEVAASVVEGLKLHLASDELKRLAEHGTKNAEAYELFLKANEYGSRWTRQGYHHALEQLAIAIELDPGYADALRFKAVVLAALYRLYERDPNLLIDAEQLVKRALALKPDYWEAYGALSNVYRQQGNLHEAEEAAKEFVLHAPDYFLSHSVLGIFYWETGQPALAISPFEREVELKPENYVAYWNLVGAADQAGDSVRVKKWSHAAIPLLERRLRLVPDDETIRVWYANMLRFADEPERAIEALSPLLAKESLDGVSLYNIACLYVRLNHPTHAIEALRRTVASGFTQIDFFHTDPDLEPLRSTAEFSELLKELEGKLDA